MHDTINSFGGVNGTDFSDWIQQNTPNAGQGGYIANARGGNDSIFGTERSDNLSGGPGSDYIYGRGNTSDYLFGDGGSPDDFATGVHNDTIYGNSGNDQIFGGVGNDSLVGRGGVDAIYGEDGNDIIFGNAGDDYIFGGQGRDTMTGGTGKDTMYGGTENDTFYADDDEVDKLYGEAGAHDWADIDKIGSSNIDVISSIETTV